jgi:antitoxin (DNA-binding transcriptional repressor) of toxin-antitoxin stability system
MYYILEVRTIGRRELNHRLAQVLDEVLATGEPVEIVTRGARPLVISLKSESLYDGWIRQGLVEQKLADLALLDSVVPVASERTTEEILGDVRDGR